MVVSTTNIELFIDGISRGTDTHDNSIPTNNNNVEIGRNTYGASDYFDGQIDDARIYNYALTAKQVETEYNQGAVSFQP